jgi:hypothetical protein
MVTIESLPESRIAYIKCLRQTAGLGLKQASDMANEPAPVDLVAGVDSDVAEHLAQLLRGAGATVQVKDSLILTPMLLWPGANRKYSKHWLKGYAPSP